MGTPVKCKDCHSCSEPCGRTKMTEEKLKPCPFCGTKAIILSLPIKSSFEQYEPSRQHEGERERG